MIVKSVLIAPLLLFVGFVGWMNLTPGHYYHSRSCGSCEVVYGQFEPSSTMPVLCAGPMVEPKPCVLNVLDNLKLLASQFDFNR